MMMFLPLLAALAAGLATFVSTPVVVRWAKARDLVCRPDGRRRIHNRPVPRLGGVAIVLGTVVGLVVGSIVEPGWITALASPERTPWVLAGVVLGAVITFGAGLYDDLKGLRPWVKLVCQVVAALVAYGLGLRIEVLSWGSAELTLGLASLPLTILWIVGVTNAYNLVDGMDGLAAGLGFIAFSAIVAAAATLGHAEVVLIGAALVGALLGFLPHNFNPAKVFMGDSGSLFVGFILAVLSVHGSMKGPTAVLVAVPLFAVAIPILDTAVAMGRRWLRGSPLSQADARHIHHRLVALGLSHRRAVVVLYGAGAAFAGLGILLGFAPPPQVALIAAIGGLASLTVLVVAMQRLGYDEFLLAGKVLASGPRRARKAIRDRILAADLAQILQVAQSTEEMNAVLLDAAEDFGFVQMVACPGNSANGRPLTFSAAPTWKLDFPLCPHEDAPDPMVLRIYSLAEDPNRPTNVERVAHILAASLSSRLEAQRRCCSPLKDPYVEPPKERNPRIHVHSA